MQIHHPEDIATEAGMLHFHEVVQRPLHGG
jgi:hypothetical protein